MLMEIKKIRILRDELFATQLDLNCTNCPVEDGDPLNKFRRLNPAGNIPQLETLERRRVQFPIESPVLDELSIRCKTCFTSGKRFELSITAKFSCLWRGKFLE